MNKIIFFGLFGCALLYSGDASTLSKIEYYNRVIAPQYDKKLLPDRIEKISSYDDRKRSVLDKGNLTLRLSNAAIYGYDRWGLNHEFPAGSMLKDGCCTYYWTASPMVGGLINGEPSVAVGVRGSVRDNEEEFEPLSGYDSGVVDAIANIGIAFSDMPESWPATWPRQTDNTGTYESIIYDIEGNGDTLYFPGIEPELGPDGFPDAPCGIGVQAEREAYFVVTDNDPAEGNTFASNNGVGPLNVRFDVWVLNYSLSFGNDGLIFIQQMTNVGKDTIKDCYVGIAGDPDAPEQGGAEWTDDFALFIPKNDSLIAEKLVDTTDAKLLSNFALVYDGDDASEGFKSSGIGWIGLKFLECTKFNSDGTDSSYDVSNFYTYEYSQDSQSDAQAYTEQMQHGIQTPQNITPNVNDIYQKPYSYGPDITWVINAGPFDVAPGEQVIFTFADFVGINEADLIRNAKLFQSLYDNDCATPKPPESPVVQVIEDDGQIVLFWDDRSEDSVDPVTLNNAFQGYRVYRSMDRGNMWGTVVTDLNGDPTDVYKPLAIYDKPDGIAGSYVITDPLIYYNLGSDAGLQYSFVDNNVVNGYEYWYAVSAYDGPDDWAGSAVDPLENSRSKNAYANDSDNTVAAIPQKNSAGFDRGSFTVDHSSGESDAVLTAVLAVPSTLEFLGLPITPDDFVSKGHTYTITFGDTVLYDTTEVTSDSSFAAIDTIESNYYSVYDTDVMEMVVSMDTSDISAGIMTHVIDGFIPLFSDAAWDIQSFSSLETIADNDTSTSIVFGGIYTGSTDGTFAGFLENIPVNQPEGRPELSQLQLDLDFRFGENSIACYFNSTLTTVDTIALPFSIWSTEENKQIGCLVYQAAGSKPIIEETNDRPGVYEFTKNVFFIPIYESYNANITHLFSFDYAADAGLFGWMMKFNKSSTRFESGNIFRVSFQNPLLPGEDVYTITTVADDYVLEQGDIDEILVVPNPYKSTSAYESVAYERELQFQNLPEKCVIRIYNTAGELVQILKHEENSNGWRGPSIEAWDLQTYNRQEIAFGVYLFHVISAKKEFISKFAVIK
ncbi:MAG: hypothetical protein ACE5D0_01755 [Fidelibacterota bacterium]